MGRRVGIAKIKRRNKQKYNDNKVVHLDRLKRVSKGIVKPKNESVIILEYFFLKVPTTKATITYSKGNTYQIFVWVYPNYQENKDQRVYRNLFDTIMKIGSENIEINIGKKVPYDLPEDAFIVTPGILKDLGRYGKDAK